MKDGVYQEMRNRTQYELVAYIDGTRLGAEELGQRNGVSARAARRLMSRIVRGLDPLDRLTTPRKKPEPQGRLTKQRRPCARGEDLTAIERLALCQSWR